MTAAFDYDEAGGEAGWATSCRTESGKHRINTYGYCYWCGMSKAEVEVNKLRDLLKRMYDSIDLQTFGEEVAAAIGPLPGGE